MDCPETLLDLVTDCVQRGLEFLSATQASDGSFPLEVDYRVEPARAERTTTTFAAAFIAVALRGIPPARELCGRAIGFLRRTAEPGPVWRFGGPADPRDADVDDTALALSAFALWAPGDTLLTAASPLDLQRVPVPTYLRDSRLPNSQDRVANANVLLAGELLRWPTVPLRHWLFSELAGGKWQEGSPYYLHKLAFLHALARAVSIRGCTEKEARMVREAAASSLRREKAPLQAGLAISSHTLVGGDPSSLSDAVLRLCRQQQSDGGWETGDYFRCRTKEIYYHGRTLAATCALEALWSWREATVASMLNINAVAKLDGFHLQRQRESLSPRAPAAS